MHKYSFLKLFAIVIKFKLYNTRGTNGGYTYVLFPFACDLAGSNEAIYGSPVHDCN